MMTRHVAAKGGLAGWLLIAAWTPASAQAPDGFAACVRDLRRDAIAQGISRATFDTATVGLTFDSSFTRARASQPEFVTPIWDYLASLVDDERIADGRARLAEWATVLAAVEKQYGVDRHVIIAVWGVETDYGRVQGTRPLVRSLATGSCSGSRRPFFQRELMAALTILERGDVAPAALVGSWAGAIGHTQFMPSTFVRLAVDGDGDGRRDLIGSIPDALASAANYLKQGGWVEGASWGYEVRLPARFRLTTGRRTRRPIAEWTAAGVKRLDGRALTGSGSAAVLRPAGPTGPAFLVFRNFDVIYSYNAAESYALAIAHLADRVRGGPEFTTPWPTDDRGLSRAERREVQQLLAERGYDIGAADGVMGSRTQAAVKAFQKELGAEPTGRAGGQVLDSLRVRTKPRT